MDVFITGASGYIGSSVVEKCLERGFHIKAVVRKRQALDEVIEQVLIADLSLKPDLSVALKGVDVVIHVAARAHILDDSVAEPLAEFRKVNVDGTLNLARQVAEARVKRFVFISSIGVNGNNNSRLFNESDKPSPQEPYAFSKYEAEQGLLCLAQKTDMEVVIIRPPLVYGFNAPGNFGSVMKWVNKRIPMPFGAIRNQRSFIALDNLVGFIIHCIDHPKAANEVFLISDGEDVSTTQLLKKVTKSFGKRTFLLPIPVSWMTFSAKMIGKADVANRLFGSLQVDSSKARDLLGWKPVVTMDEQLKKIADAAK